MSKISARNQIKGKVQSIKKGAVTDIVKIDIGGQIITSSITGEAVEELDLKEGSAVTVIIKSSDVLIATD
ncbi:TOBE domain-containing protein [Chelatococcus reniformis]|nr:TOBE domain-containing protein [Chelatococcus reniformis]